MNVATTVLIIVLYKYTTLILTSAVSISSTFTSTSSHKEYEVTRSRRYVYKTRNPAATDEDTAFSLAYLQLFRLP
jgi:hypothetical protein